MVDRYRASSPTAVIIHRADFALLQRLLEIIEAPVDLDRLPVTDLALELHQAGERGTGEVDPDAVSMLAALEE